MTRDWLCEHRLVPCENYASGHCWWVANAEITGLCIQEAQRRVVAFASLHALPATICDGLTAEFTHKEHIAVAVHALRSWYKDGLLVLHAQFSIAWLFLTTGECRYISMPVASAWKAEHTWGCCDDVLTDIRADKRRPCGQLLTTWRSARMLHSGTHCRQPSTHHT